MTTAASRVIFFGTPDYAADVLSALIAAEYQIVAVVTQPDRVLGRKKELTPTAVKIRAQQHGINVLTPEKITTEFIHQITVLTPTVAVLVAYGVILPQRLLDIPEFGFLNIHPSLLPLYRGSSPIKTALCEGEKHTGVTLMKMDAKMDHGPILAQTTVPINSDDTIITLRERLFEHGIALLLTTLPAYLEHTIKPFAQDEKSATYTKMLQKNDGKIDWMQSADSIAYQVRAYLDWPGSYATWQNQKFTIKKAAIYESDKKNNQPGLVEQEKNKILVNCGSGKLELLEVQLAGKKNLLISDFLRGANNFIGSVLE